MSQALLTAENLTRSFPLPGREPVVAVANADLQLDRGQIIVVRGPSGSGKTTLLMMLAGMLKPDSGTVLFSGCDIYSLSVSKRVDLRATRMGVVLPMFHLLPYLNAADNVSLGTRSQAERKQAADLLQRVGLADRAKQLPDRMSAGERRRLMVARALVHSPDLILADEPTANLDPDSSKLIRQLLCERVQAGSGLLIVTHDDPNAFSVEIVYDMRTGQLRRVES